MGELIGISGVHEATNLWRLVPQQWGPIEWKAEVQRENGALLE